MDCLVDFNKIMSILFNTMLDDFFYPAETAILLFSGKTYIKRD